MCVCMWVFINMELSLLLIFIIKHFLWYVSKNIFPLEIIFKRRLLSRWHLKFNWNSQLANTFGLEWLTQYISKVYIYIWASTRCALTNMWMHPYIFFFSSYIFHSLFFLSFLFFFYYDRRYMSLRVCTLQYTHPARKISFIIEIMIIVIRE